MSIIRAGFEYGPVLDVPAGEIFGEGYLSNGTYRYVFTRRTRFGETAPGPASNVFVITAVGSGLRAGASVRIGIPPAPANTVAWRLYRTGVGAAGPFRYVGEALVGANAIVDPTADADLGALPPIASTAASQEHMFGSIIYHSAGVYATEQLMAVGTDMETAAAITAEYTRVTGSGGVRLPPAIIGTRCSLSNIGGAISVYATGATIEGSPSVALVGEMTFVCWGTVWYIEAGSGGGGGGTVCVLDDDAVPQAPLTTDDGVWYGRGTRAHVQADAVALGNGAEANDSGCVALGGGAVAQGQQSISIGNLAFAGLFQNVVIGYNAACDEEQSVVIGNKSSALRASGVSIGSFAQTVQAGNIAIGSDSVASGESSISVGQNASSIDIYSIAVGYNATADEICTAVGGYTTASNQSSAIGFACQADSLGVSVGLGCVTMSGTNSLAVGVGAMCTGSYSVALGSGGVSTTGDNTVAVGSGAIAAAENAVAVGLSATVISVDGIAIGRSASVQAEYGVSLGSNAMVFSSGGIAVGYNAQSIRQSIVVGNNASCSVDGGVALGYDCAVSDPSYGLGLTLNRETILPGRLGVVLNRVNSEIEQRGSLYMNYDTASKNLILDVNSAKTICIIGSDPITVTLPDGTTLREGFVFKIFNDARADVEVVAFGGARLTVLRASNLPSAHGDGAHIFCTDARNNTWSYRKYPNSV